MAASVTFHCHFHHQIIICLFVFLFISRRRDLHWHRSVDKILLHITDVYSFSYNDDDDDSMWCLRNIDRKSSINGGERVCPVLFLIQQSNRKFYSSSLHTLTNIEHNGRETRDGQMNSQPVSQQYGMGMANKRKRKIIWCHRTLLLLLLVYDK